MALSVVLAYAQPSVAELNLGPQEIVQAAGVDLQVAGYSVPSLVRWDGDALDDLIVGEGGDVVSEAKVRVYLNSGSLTSPQFTSYFYVQSNGRDLVTAAGGCMGNFPRVVYWDGDARKDLLVGLADGTVAIYLNVHTDDEPRFDGGTLLRAGPPPLQPPINVEARATPSVVDWNEDGKKDLLVGAVSGKIHLFLNEGTDASPLFTSESLLQEAGADLLVPCERSSPQIVDLDGDGRKDLLTGNTCGELLFYGNVGTDAAPEFSGFSFVESEGLPIDLPGTPRSRPFVCDWTRDGQWDVLIGAADGKLQLYQEDDPPTDIILFVSKEDGDVRFDWASSGQALYDVVFAASPSQVPFDPLPGAQAVAPPAFHEGGLGDALDRCYLVQAAD